MFCPVCGKDSTVRVEMVGSTTEAAGTVGTINRCVKGHVIPDQVDSLAGFTFGDGEAADEFQAQFTPHGSQTKQSPRAPTTPPAKVAAAEKLAARDSLKDIKARRRDIAVEVRRLEALRTEDEELAAAERAIESSRRSKKVRPLRTEVAS